MTWSILLIQPIVALVAGILVVVPYDTLKFADNKVTLPGGTKGGLKLPPEFKYGTE